MAINPLTNRPVPPNSVSHRAMFFWSGSPAGADPLDTDTEVNNLIGFLDDTNVGCNVLFLDIWRYLGGSNWTNTKRDRLFAVLDGLKRSGVKVYALAGDLGWGNDHDWVQDNIIEPVMSFNAMATSPSKQFDGIIFDVEYWQDEGTYSPSVHCPGLCELMKSTKRRTNLEVGCFAAFYLKDNDATRSSVSYNGKSAQDGEHFMDSCDFVVVGCYRDHAEDNGTDGPGQITLFQPWYDYASGEGVNCALYAGAETIDVSPSYLTYFGASKATMQTELALIAAAFLANGNSAFMGIAVHNYDSWKAMS